MLFLLPLDSGNAGAWFSSLTCHFRFPQINFANQLENYQQIVIDFTVHWIPINLSIQRRKKSIILQKKRLQRDLIMMKGSFQCNVHANFSTHSLSRRAQNKSIRAFFFADHPSTSTVRSFRSSFSNIT